MQVDEPRQAEETTAAEPRRHRSWRASAVSRRWRPLLTLICLGLVLGMAFQGTRGLWSPDEGRYVDGALGMLDSGNWLVPAYSPVEINLSKPPLTYWVVAASFKLFGRNTWAARVPYALAYVATIWLLYGMGLCLFREKPWLPGLIYAISLFPFLAANVVSTDVLLALAEGLAMYGFVAYAFAPEGRRRAHRLLVLMWVGWGAAFLTKGPPGLLPLLAVIPFTVWRDGWRGAARLFPPLGVLLFLLVGLGWYAALVLRVPWALHYFLHTEVYDRIFTAVQHRNAGPFGWLIVYLPTVIVGSLPWWPGLARRLLRRRMHETDANAPKRRIDAAPLLWLWFLIPLVVFCLARSRLPLYVLPLFVPLSLLMAHGLQRWIDVRRRGRRAALAAWVIVLLALKGGVAYAVRTPDDNRMAAQQLGAITASKTYAAVVFVEATASHYDVEEATPWGVRLYLAKPVYGVAWRSTDGAAELCRAVQHAGSALVVIDPGLADARMPVSRTLEDCTHRPPSGAGIWNRHPLLLARVQGV